MHEGGALGITVRSQSVLLSHSNLVPPGLCAPIGRSRPARANQTPAVRALRTPGLPPGTGTPHRTATGVRAVPPRYPPPLKYLPRRGFVDWRPFRPLTTARSGPHPDVANSVGALARYPTLGGPRGSRDLRSGRGTASHPCARDSGGAPPATVRGGARQHGSDAGWRDGVGLHRCLHPWSTVGVATGWTVRPYSAARLVASRPTRPSRKDYVPGPAPVTAGFVPLRHRGRNGLRYQSADTLA